MAVNLIVGGNSYISVSDADTYFSERLFSEAWTGATDEVKAKALIMATRKIDTLSFKGKKLDNDQSLAFPRYIYNPKVCLEYMDKPTVYSGSSIIEITDRLKHAVCEEALVFIKGIPKRIELQQQGVKQAQVGNITEIYTERKIKLISSEARELLRPYMVGSVRIT